MYYPKSQIKTNLYTNGDEFIFLDSKQPYTGYYFKTSTEQYFTGRTPDDLPNIEIILNSALLRENIPTNQSNYSVVINTDLVDNSIYNNLVKPSPILISPSYNAPIPTQQDYETGEFRRYFCKKGNEILYLEIDKVTYDKLIVKDPQYLYSLYEPFNLPWKLTGTQEEVEKVNRNIVELTSKRLQLPQFGRYLKDDYLKYYK
jgi:hypothetical protein